MATVLPALLSTSFRALYQRTFHVLMRWTYHVLTTHFIARHRSNSDPPHGRREKHMSGKEREERSRTGPKPRPFSQSGKERAPQARPRKRLVHPPEPYAVGEGLATRQPKPQTFEKRCATCLLHPRKPRMNPKLWKFETYMCIFAFKSNSGNLP